MIGKPIIYIDLKGKQHPGLLGAKGLVYFDLDTQLTYSQGGIRYSFDAEPDILLEDGGWSGAPNTWRLA